MLYPSIEIDPKAYESEHIRKVLNVIKKNFHEYYESYIGTKLTSQMSNAIERLGSKYNVTDKNDTFVDHKKIITDRFKKAIDHFDTDRGKYLEILDLDLLKEEEEDPPGFKDSLSRNCPIIHKTLNSPMKDLKDYKIAFRQANALEMLNVVKNISLFGNGYFETIDYLDYENIKNYKDLKLDNLLDDEYIVHGCIGGGIRSHLLYKLDPRVFPNRSQNSLWALYYLVDKNTFGFEEDSEFLMIEIRSDVNITQQNYWYPYDLYSYYALKIYLMLKDKCSELNINLSDQYRYVYLDTFFEHIADNHLDEINKLRERVTVDRAY